eukprot:gene3063-3610_t
MQIFYKNADGVTTTLDVTSSDTVNSLMDTIEAREGLGPGRCRIVFAGKQLDGGRTLASYDIQKENTVHVLPPAALAPAPAAAQAEDAEGQAAKGALSLSTPARATGTAATRARAGPAPTALPASGNQPPRPLPDAGLSTLAPGPARARRTPHAAQAYLDLGQAYLCTGQYQDASKLLYKAKDHCSASNPKEAIELLLLICKMHFSTQTYPQAWPGNHQLCPRPTPYAPLHCLHHDLQARATFDRLDRDYANNWAGTPPGLGMVKAGLGLCRMEERQFGLAAEAFTQTPFELRDGYSEVLSAADIVVFGTLCGLASWDRKKLRATLFNVKWRQRLALRPDMRVLCEDFIDGNYARLLKSLDELKAMLILDLHVSKQAEHL